ncbi:MAG: hypothetical protein HRU27_19415 [Rhizobiaceae bacterium]|nr:hypothetical protein [Hyphomicrobiales bacterium]NRB32762.1 hypothetical protein [Rhizobiaceae bacterium]
MQAEARLQKPIWMTVLIMAAVILSFALDCGMPFAGLGALAVLALTPRDAAALAGFGWLANQVIGFGFLGYPIDVLTLAWGGALGLSSLAAVGGSLMALRLSKSDNPLKQVSLSFLGAWAAQQLTVLAATVLLGGTETAFAPSVVWFIFWTNTLAFAALMSIQLLGARAGIAQQPLGQFVG